MHKFYSLAPTTITFLLLIQIARTFQARASQKTQTVIC